MQTGICSIRIPLPIIPLIPHIPCRHPPGASSLPEDAVFAGWYESADFSGNKVTSVAANRTGDITLYAKFELGIISAGTYYLTAGVEYKLGNVTKVSRDNSVYTPGSTFYVSASGTYTFK
jgi:uncharacterized repeat protein (TIGR02543 family)